MSIVDDTILQKASLAGQMLFPVLMGMAGSAAMPINMGKSAATPINTGKKRLACETSKSR